MRLLTLACMASFVLTCTTGMAGAAAEHRKLTQQLELQRHALSLLQERIAGSESAQLAEAAGQLATQASQAMGGVCMLGVGAYRGCTGKVIGLV